MTQPPLSTYWVTVCVELHTKIYPDPDDTEEDDSRPVVGYFRNFGVTSHSEQAACEEVAMEIVEGDIDWSDSTSYPVNPETLDSIVLERTGDWSVPGIWYRSGRILFPED